MLNYISTFLKFGSRYCGIEHRENIIITTILKKTTKEVSIEDTISVDSIEKLSEKLDKGQHAFLIINDNNVLTHTLESNQTDSSRLVNKAFPNLNTDEFYSEVISQGDQHIIAICRKQIVEDIIAKYNEHNIVIQGFSLGVLKLSQIASFLPSETIFLNTEKVELRDNKLVSVDKTSESISQAYKVNGLSVDNKQLLSFSAGMDLILPNGATVSNFDAENNALLNGFMQKRFFKVFMAFSLIFFLGLLLTNFFIFNHYYGRVGDLQQTSQANDLIKNNILTLNQDVAKKQKIVDDMLSSASSKSSYYLDDLVNMLPVSIALSEFNFQPLEKRVKSDQPIQVNKQTILISGNSNNSDEFSKWLASLESESWVKNAEIIEYSDTSKSNSEFSIKLILND